MITRKQVAWAATHDWFISGSSDSLKMDDTVYRSGAITVRDIVRGPNGVISSDVRSFVSFAALYEWAGY